VDTAPEGELAVRARTFMIDPEENGFVSFKAAEQIACPQVAVIEPDVVPATDLGSHGLEQGPLARRGGSEVEKRSIDEFLNLVHVLNGPCDQSAGGEDAEAVFLDQAERYGHAEAMGCRKEAAGQGARGARGSEEVLQGIPGIAPEEAFEEEGHNRVGQRAVIDLREGRCDDSFQPLELPGPDVGCDTLPSCMLGRRVDMNLRPRAAARQNGVRPVCWKAGHHDEAMGVPRRAP